MAHDELAPLSGEHEEELDPPIAVEDGLASPVVWRLVVLFAMTILALVVAWCWPDDTVLHFWLVAQCLPVAYVVLLGWSVWERRA